MVLFAGIDEAGYGPPLGPLVVAGTAFHVPERPDPEQIWRLLGDAVCRRAGHSDGRLVVDDSKRVYTSGHGLRLLEEGVLGFVHVASGRRQPAAAGELFTLLEGRRSSEGQADPWFVAAPGLPLPLESNRSALASKTDVLHLACRQSGARPVALRAATVFPPEFNRVVRATHSKAALLWQKTGLLLQEFWRFAGPGESHIIVDHHGGRVRYRKLILDVFPDLPVDIVSEEKERSVYRLRDEGADGERTLLLSFIEKADSLAFPVSLASMVAKYVRELYMHAFNGYWCGRVEGLRPTAGYGRDARRFVRDIAPALDADGVDHDRLVRMC